VCDDEKIRWARMLELPLAYEERDLVQSMAVFATRHASGGDFSLSRGAGGTRVVIVLAEQADAPVGLRLVQRYRFTYMRCIPPSVDSIEGCLNHLPP